MEPIENRKKRKPKTAIKFHVTLNEEQKEAKSLIMDSDVVLLCGAAGSGKSLLAAQVALDTFFTRQTGKIIITRPVVPAGEDIGFLKGDLMDKMAPWSAGIMGNLYQLRDKKEIDQMVTDGNIETVPIAYMRSRTFLDSTVIVEEAQNITSHQLELLLGRLGRDSKLIFTGDLAQTDLRHRADSCIPLFRRLAERIPTVRVIELKTNHRHPIVPLMLEVLAGQ